MGKDGDDLLDQGFEDEASGTKDIGVTDLLASILDAGLFATWGLCWSDTDHV